MHKLEKLEGSFGKNPRARSEFPIVGERHRILLRDHEKLSTR